MNAIELTTWWGTYPAKGLGAPTGQGEGVWRVNLTVASDDVTEITMEAEQVIEMGAPSFVLKHPDLPVLYAVCEEDETTVVAMSVRRPHDPRLKMRVDTGGSGGCHLMLSHDASTLYVVHYSSGDIAAIGLSPTGYPIPDGPFQLLGHEGSGPREDRQEGPHAHFVGYSPGETRVLVADLGTDELRRYLPALDGSLKEDGIAVTFPPGSGPRHFAVHHDVIWVVCELDHTLRTLVWNPVTATAEIVDEQPTTLAPQRTGDAIYDAHIERVGGVLLVSVRGCNVISVFDLDSEGVPVYRAAFDTGGDWPRHFKVSGELLLVGNEKSHEACVFDMADVLSIARGETPDEIQELPHATVGITSPACVAP